MRYWQFGIFDSQAADIHGDSWGGRSVLVWDDNTFNQEAAAPWNYDVEDMPIGHGGGAEAFHNQMLVDIALAQLKAKLGQIPVLLRVDWTMKAYGSTPNAGYMQVTRMYSGWDIGDSSNRYKDRSALITWYEDAYSPYPGQDRASVMVDQIDVPPLAVGDTMTLNVTSILARALRDNVSVKLWFHGYTGGATSHYTMDFKPLTDSTRRPYLSMYYLYPIEFYEASGGQIDLSSTVQETEDGHYYLGAVERGSTGSAIMGWIRNYTNAIQQVEIFDDHAEWVTPVQRVGTGTGKLDFVTLAENATSQLYTVVFYSSTEYEVKAEAYRDNPIGYHPQIDVNGSWRSDINSTKTFPSGGLTLTAAMWQGANINSGDEFEIGVRGNTTDTGWPADSNDQVEMCGNNAGVPDGDWRPAEGRRERTTAGVTVDATTKFFPLRHVVPAEWVASIPCFIQSVDDINEGTITGTQEADLPVGTFTGSGLDDCIFSGNYNGNADNDYRVVIDATGGTDTFSWSRTGDATYIATGVNCSTSPVLLENGVYVTFGAATGHTLTDRWDSAALTWGITVGGLTANSNAYNSGSWVCTTLPMRDLEAALFSTVSLASGASESPASRIYLEDTTPFTQGDTIFIQQVGDDGPSESAIIATGGVLSAYIDLTTSLVNDYAVGDFCTVEGTGERAFWMRPVATTTTVEELKRLRFNARIL